MKPLAKLREKVKKEKTKISNLFFKDNRCYLDFLSASILLMCIILYLYFSVYLQTHFIYSNLFVLPIILFGLWYGKKEALSVALFFGWMIIINDIVISNKYLNEDLMHVVIFILTGFIIGTLKEKHQHSEKVIEHQTYHDLLTGLPNRLRFEDFLQKEIELAKEKKQMLAVFFIDLDRFKYINDILGHIAGDTLLVQVSKRLREVLIEVLHKEPLIARSGGDEFLALVSGIPGEKEINEIAVLINDGFKKRFYIHEREVYITTSIGISIFPAHGENAKNLISYADIAMYKAKDIGKNTYKVFNSEMNEDISDKLHIANSMRQIVEEGNFDSFLLHYQPQVQANINKIVGVEALLRWNHPEKGLLYPGKFIEVAEETGLIVPIGKWVLRTACLQAKKWQENFDPGLKLSVNISEQQLRDKNFCNDVFTILKETGYEPSLLELEITESVAMNNSDRNIEILDELRNIGVRIALDDFGTGYSSLNYLGTLPINILKVDYELVKEIPFNIKNSAIATSIISLAACLNYEVVAEGVETEAQLDFFKQQKCDYIQGFLFSRPLPPEELEVLL